MPSFNGYGITHMANIYNTYIQAPIFVAILPASHAAMPC